MIPIDDDRDELDRKLDREAPLGDASEVYDETIPSEVGFSVESDHLYLSEISVEGGETVVDEISDGEVYLWDRVDIDGLEISTLKTLDPEAARELASVLCRAADYADRQRGESDE